ncbi:MAG: hypothetical protein ABI548_13510 [Polyangiaceae bacterium]
MPTQDSTTHAEPAYGEARPERIPRPTVWPGALAFAITFLAWSLVTSAILALVGALVFAVALAGWIAEAIHEREGTHEGP